MIKKLQAGRLIEKNPKGHGFRTTAKWTREITVKKVDRGCQESLQGVSRKLTKPVKKVDTIIIHKNINNNTNKLPKKTTKIKTKLQETIDYYFKLKGWKYETDDPTEKEKMKIRYKRNLRDAKELLVMCDQDVPKATAKIFKLKGWATHNNCSWNLGTVVKRFDEDNFKADKTEFINTQTGEVFKTAEELSASYKKLDQAKRSTNGFEKI